MGVIFNPLNGNFDFIGDSAVTSVNSQTGDVVLDANDVDAANQNLSNLDSPTAINQDLLPNTDSTKNIGSGALFWNSAYSKNIFLDTISIEDDYASYWWGNSPAILIDNSATALNIQSKDESGTGTGTASISVLTGHISNVTNVNNTGSFDLFSGSTLGSGNSGPTAVGSGDSDTGNTGSVTILSGISSSGGSTGQIRLLTGSTSGTRGDILLESPSINFNNQFSLLQDNTYSWWGGPVAGVFVENDFPDSYFIFGSKDATGASEVSTAMTLLTGAQTNVSATSLTGEIDINTGENFGTNGTGPLLLFTGRNLNASAAGTTGAITLQSGHGDSIDTGQILVFTGDTDTGDSGSIIIRTGASVSGTREQVYIQGNGINLQTLGTQPAASSAYRGTLWYTQSGTLVSDKIEICIKDATDTYVWKQFTLV